MRILPAWTRLPEAWIVAAIVAARAVPAFGAGIGRDEAAHWYWAWHGLDASYSWITGASVRATTAVLGDAAWAARAPGLLAGVAMVVVVFNAARHLGAGRRAAVVAGLAVASAPTVTHLGSFVHPDAWLLLFAMLFAERSAAIAARGPGHVRIVAAAGAAALAGLSKLPGTLLLAPALRLLLPGRRAGWQTLSAGVVLSGGAFALAAARDPEIHRGVRELGTFAPELSVVGRAGTIATEMVTWCGPALLAAALAGGVALREARLRTAWPAWTAAVLWLGVFGAFLLAGQSKANWFVPALVLLVPPGVVAVERAGRLGALRVLVAASAAMSVLQAGAVMLPSEPAVWRVVESWRWPTRLDATYAAHVGPREAAVSTARTWRQRAAEYHSRPGADPRLGGATIASADYGLAFRIAHARGRDARVWLPWDPIFARVAGGPPAAGTDVLFVSGGEGPAAEWAARFREVRELAPVEGSDPDLRVWRCTGWNEGRKRVPG